MSASPRQTVESFLTAFQLKDVDAALTTVSPDAEVTIFPVRVIDGGRSDVRVLLEAYIGAFPDLLVTVKSVIELGRVVVVELTLEGTQSADFLGAINQEKHLDLNTAWRFTVTGDEITALEAYWCQNQLYRRLAVKRQDDVTIVHGRH